MKDNTFFLTIVLLLFGFNLVLPDIFLYLNTDNTAGSFDPLAGNLDYLRHHTAARQIYEGTSFFALNDQKFNSLPYLYAQPLPTILYGVLNAVLLNTTSIVFLLSSIF